MKVSFFSARAIAVFAAVTVGVVLTGCATRVKTSQTVNPPPAQAFSAFGRIELRPVRMVEGKRTADGIGKIQDNITKSLKAYLENWNKQADNGRKLLIEPIVDDIEIQQTGKRILLGPMAGSSGVMMHLKITDTTTGQEVANPLFFQRADALAAGFTFGVNDNLMLTRVANLASDYVIANYAVAKGGPTGADDKAVAAANK